MEETLQISMRMTARLRLFLTIVFVLISLNGAPVAAQDPLPVEEPPGKKIDGLPFDSSSTDLQTISTEQQGINTSQGGNLRSSDTVDDFGYSWDDTIPVEWIDATNGLETGLRGSSNGQFTGPISLGFNFPYYENVFSQVFIAASGYLSFTNAGTWPNQSQIPTAALPNNVIAPYWAPLFLSTIGPSGQIFYRQGGQSPERYFVVEWYQVHESIPDTPVAGDDVFHFEVILYENGDIRFQYDLIKYTGSSYCGSAGIEDSTGDDGLAYLPLCTAAPSYRGVLISRPGHNVKSRE